MIQVLADSHGKDEEWWFKQLHPQPRDNEMVRQCKNDLFVAYLYMKQIQGIFALIYGKPEMELSSSTSSGVCDRVSLSANDVYPIEFGITVTYSFGLNSSGRILNYLVDAKSMNKESHIIRFSEILWPLEYDNLFEILNRAAIKLDTEND